MLKKCMLFALSVLATTGLSADMYMVGGRYEMNADGNKLVLDLMAEDGEVKGKARHYAEGNGMAVDRVYNLRDGFYVEICHGDRHYVEFDVVVPSMEPEGEAEVFTLEGWQSDNGMHIGGLGHSRSDPINQFPWMATRVADIPIPDEPPMPTPPPPQPPL